MSTIEVAAPVPARELLEHLAHEVSELEVRARQLWGDVVVSDALLAARIASAARLLRTASHTLQAGTVG